MRRGVRRTLLFFILGMLVLVLIEEHEGLMEIPVYMLERWDMPPEHTDAVFILLGDTGTRALYATRLIEEGYASLIAMGQVEPKSIAAFGLMPDETAIACTVLVRSGIPPTMIRVIPATVSSTFEEAKAAREWAKESGMDSLLFVTSSYHSTRANWILNRVFDSSGVHVFVASVPVPAIDWLPWWKTENGMIIVFNEIAKNIYYNITFRKMND